ncbi:phytoene/squalene synthase family protein [Sanguibacter antarcticus]|uniref:Phytoene/squalene synthetase n=1 Tax=Sanguibacter antarcticus TaxID=372484 RepID=A0A2A9E278_9MICO|nr:squalene/phytoene synthase family protein [Sanguibacter antarcticus]PFG32756.1 phytoene/squalene synthetase [Sanguibacter antarcticus]
MNPSDETYDAVAQASAAAVIRGYSTSFGWACRLLKATVRADVRNIYALVRLADEIVDGPHGASDPQQAVLRLDALEASTAETLESGYSTNLVVHAFGLTARRYGIGADLVDPFFRSMRTDVDVREHTPESLADYIYGSAEVVGLMCLRVFLGAAGRDDWDAMAPGASRLGAAFQKINFLRDLAADHDELGRVYFPGLDVEHFTDEHKDALLDDIRADLDAADAAIVRLPANSRTAVAAAHGLFSELTTRIAATPARDLLRTRVRVPGPTKARVLAAALARSSGRSRGDGARPAGSGAVHRTRAAGSDRTLAPARSDETSRS